MSLIDRDRLLQTFKERLDGATRVDIAVAWATPCDAVEALLEAAHDTTIRIVVGTSRTVTTPNTLHRLNEATKLRVVGPRNRGIFHPKYYHFRNADTSVCWVGSSNLTRSGFGSNVELVNEFAISSDEDLDWFERIWADLDSDPLPAIAEYENRYERDYRPPRRSLGRRRDGRQQELLRLAEVTTWAEFVEGLRARDDRCHGRKEPWDVLGETRSHLHTILAGRDVIRRNNWTNLTRRECHILRGERQSADGEGCWALLGDVRGVPDYVFNPARMPEVESVRNEVRNVLSEIIDPSWEGHVEDVQRVLAGISNRRLPGRRRIGPAAATRWLALARPDRFVSVNRAARVLLSQNSGLPQSKITEDKYGEFLAWLWNRPWFHEMDETQLADPLERDIWHCRAALVDAFAYDRLND